MKKRRIMFIVFSCFSLLVTLLIPNIFMIEDDLGPVTIIGKNGLMVFLFLTMMFYLLWFHKPILRSLNKLLLYIVLCFVVLIPTLLLASTELVWLIPLTACAMIITVMLDESLGITTNVILTLLIALVGNLGLDYILFNVLSGTISCLLITKAKERQKIFYVSTYLMLINSVIVVFLNLLKHDEFSVDFQQILFVVINAVLSIIIATGSLPLWETLFNITTSYKLLELTNSNQKLLQRLMLEAPGTYHHSQMVANLAETAALDIGANALLARTGALYHDIGKLRDPEYFVENQNGYNPHDELAPDSSAKIILAHVDDGIRLAHEYKLPHQIIEIIRQHQGDSIIRYFYEKAKRNSDGFEVNPALFKYKGPKPQTNEAAIVMLADCVEAYIRSFPEKEKNMDKIQTCIYDMIQNKLVEGQLNQCPLKVSELPIIEQAFIKVYKGLYHERVQYTKTGD